MVVRSFEKLVEEAAGHLEAGRWGLARDEFRRLLTGQPGDVRAMEGMARVALGEGKIAEAVEWRARAVEVEPGSAHVHANLAAALAASGRVDEAIASYRRAVSLRADLVEAWNGLAELLVDRGRDEEAIEAYRRLLAVCPESPEALVNLGNALYRKERWVEAIAAHVEAIRLRPDLPEAHNNLGSALMASGRMRQAIESYRKAIALRPDYADAYDHLGMALHQNGDLAESIEAFKKAVEIRPDFYAARIDLGHALKDAGQLDAALACYRAGSANPQVASNYLFSLYLHPDWDCPRILREHLRWDEAFGAPLRGSIAPHENDRSDGRRLRVGYVARNLGNHPLGRFLVPLFEHHDKSRVEVFCYCDVTRTDAVNTRLRASASAWRTTFDWSDERVAAQVRADRIDVLVDLMMHAGSNRLMVFARKPAPVQVSYLAYPGTTGLSTIDYRLTDPYLDPPLTGSGRGGPGPDEVCYSERLVRLPHTFWCYPAPAEAPEVGPLPASSCGFVTFGCLNSYGKVNAGVLTAWCRVLAAVPGSRLVLHCFAGAQRERAVGHVSGAGIDPRRLQFVGPASMKTYFGQYNGIDVALDPFPFPGGTTTCDALWMGVPVVTLPGKTGVSRGGVSILSNVGLAELVARDVEDYVRIAAELSRDVGRLAGLRAGMRERMRGSPLMDASEFARDVEDAYFWMWERWREKVGP